MVYISSYTLGLNYPIYETKTTTSSRAIICGSVMLHLLNGKSIHLDTHTINTRSIPSGL